MHGLEELLLAEEKRLECIINVIKNRRELYPEGYLKIRKLKDTIRFEHFYQNENGKKTKYINADNRKLAEGLAQKSYEAKLLKIAESQLTIFKKVNKKYQDSLIDSVYYNLSNIRKNLVKPIIPTWEQALNSWISEKYTKKALGENDSNIVAKKGHRVRSKSEKILADTLFDNNIQYKYEKPLYLKEYGTVYPDFTMLSSKTRKEIYWEHMGKMDDPDYLASALRKLENYQQHGIYQGENLIVTFEASNYIISQQVIENLIYKYLVEHLT